MIEKHCKAQDLEVVYKKGELCKNGQTDLNGLYARSCLLGVAIIAPALKFLVA